MGHPTEKIGKKLLKINSLNKLERAMGIEPTLFAWEARVLPLNDARVCDEAATAAVFDRLTVPGCELELSYIKAM